MSTLPPMSASWVARARQILARRHHEWHGGVRYFADDFSVIPGERVSPAERRRRIRAEYGAPEVPELCRRANQ